MATHSNVGALLHGERGSVAADAVSSIYAPWQTLSALAAETSHAVRQTLAESNVDTSGHVHQGLQHHAAPSTDGLADQSEEPESRLNTHASAAQRKINESPETDHIYPQAVHEDISRVKRKMMSTDAATEVILRFNFMGGRESKVRPIACLCAQANSTCLR